MDGAILMRWMLLVLAITGCVRGGGGFQCAADGDCVRDGVAGRCESVSYCSFPDGTCPNGSRFGDLSGPYANLCIGATDAGVQLDARVDARADAIPADGTPTMPVFVAEAHTNANSAGTVTYPLTVPAGTGRFLLVSVQIAADACVGVTPDVTTVTYNGVALTRVTTILGTPCSSLVTRTEQWQLVAPATGTHNLIVLLSAVAPTVHSGALLFNGVNQIAPIRGFMAASGEGTSSSVDVSSAAGDLVVNTVGQGGMITSPITGTQLFLNNVSGGNTLDNSAASSTPGTAGTVTMSWLFGANDQWQTISSSLRP